MAHVYILEAKRGKLDDKSFPCILLGVTDESKGYRLFDPKIKRIVVSKDVMFEEEKIWDWGSNYNKQTKEMTNFILMKVRMRINVRIIILRKI